MVLSLGAVIVFVVVTVALLGGSLGILRDDPVAREVRPVDYTETLRRATDVADFRVLAPGDVPEGWVAQSTRLEQPGPPASASALVQVGFLTDDGRFAGVVQSDADPAALLDSQSLGEEVEALVDVDGVPWEQHRRVDRDELALVRTEGARTVVVAGDAVLDDLRLLAGGLRPADEALDGRDGDGAGSFEPIG